MSANEEPTSRVSYRGSYGQIRASATARIVLLTLLTLLLISVLRVTATYAVFNHTYDEPFHLLRGMLWVTGRPYRHVEHPPLAEACFAIGPYLDSVQIDDTGDKLCDGSHLLYGSHRYARTLTLARVGNLVFLLWSIAVVWRWAEFISAGSGDSSRLLAGRRWPREWVGPCTAVLLFTNVPPVLAHAGVATSDMSATAALSSFVYCLMRWLDEATALRAVLLGVAAGAALLAKYSALLFLPVASLVVVFLYCTANGRRERTGLRLRLLDCMVAVLIASQVVWAGYRFSLGTMRPREQRTWSAEFRDHAFAEDGWARLVDRKLSALPLPAPEFWEGVVWLLSKVEKGHAPYFLGRVMHDEPSWLFFPVALGVKTPLPFLAMALLGGIAALRPGRRKCWRELVAPGVAAAIVVAVLPATINLGVRHILPVYPLLSILGGYGIAELWSATRARLVARCTAVALVVWLVVASARAHPDYLSYFNEFAGRHPEQILVDSDLDWGQDLNRLSGELRRRGVERVSIAYFGTARLDQHGLPEFQVLKPSQPTTGWIAISLTSMQSKPGYEWLNRHQPITTVGRSIRLYYIESIQAR